MKLFSSILACLFFVFTSLQAQIFDGYALYNQVNQHTTYLIDKNGDIAYTWSLARPCNYAVLLKENGNLMRGAVKQGGNQINGAAVGGLVQEIDPQGDVVWEFEYSSSQYVTHHDISLMPNGNVLLIAWEVKNSSELESRGFTGNANFRYATHIIEVAQDGTGGEIVWEWHIWDHMIQDVDANKPNFGVVAEHPELLDINVPTSGMGPGGDWFHVNGIDYNPDLDQIVFSSRFLSEIFVIDHSTTTEEAAGHTGGNSGKGGDFLYRWGNPSNYDTPGTQTIPGAVHDSRWIPDDGRARGGYIQFFNNEESWNTSTVDAIDPPFASDGINYEWTQGQAYGPTEATWRHICLDFASGQSASNSMPNGSTFVALSGEYMYEVDKKGDLVWQYNAGPKKGFRYTCDYPGIQALIAQDILNDGFCPVIATEEIVEESIRIFPNPSSGIFHVEGLSQDQRVESVQVFDLLGNKIQELENVSVIDLSKQAAGIYFVTILLNGGQLVSKKVSVVK